jgi:ParB-like chromosome segregation protein Spo0J
MITWTLKSISIKDLKNSPKNPRQIGKEQFERMGNLIDKFGLIDKPVVNQDMTLIGGHQRIRFLKKKKVKTVECWVADEQILDDDIDELCIGLNLHQGNWDWDILANQFDALDLLKYGFSEEQLLGACKDTEEFLDETEEKSSNKKKQKCCPNCGHEF